MTRKERYTIMSSKIENCQFYGVKWDEEAIESVKIIASALLETAKALHELSHVLKASNVTIESMVKVDS